MITSPLEERLLFSPNLAITECHKFKSMHRTDLRGNQLIIYSVLFRYFICKTQRVNDLYASLYFKTGTFNPSIWELISRWFQATQLFQLIEKWSLVFHRQKYTWYWSFSNVFADTNQMVSQWGKTAYHWYSQKMWSNGVTKRRNSVVCHLAGNLEKRGYFLFSL